MKIFKVVYSLFYSASETNTFKNGLDSFLSRLAEEQLFFLVSLNILVDSIFNSLRQLMGPLIIWLFSYCGYF